MGCLPLSVDAFTCISENAFLLAVQHDDAMAIEIFTFGLEDSVHNSDSGPESPCHMATFKFPEWTLGCRVVSPAALGSTFQNGGRNRMFKTSTASEHIILGNVVIRPRIDWRPHPRVLWFVMRVGIFLECLDARAARKGIQPEPVTYPWNMWGPVNTRCFEFNTVKGSIPCAVQGSRVLIKDKVAPKDNPSLPRDKYLLGSILDFNLLPYRRLSIHEAKRPKLFRSMNSSGRFVQEPSTVARQEVFLEDVQTNLPYYQTPVEWPSQSEKALGSGASAADIHRTSRAAVISEIWLFAYAGQVSIAISRLHYEAC